VQLEKAPQPAIAAVDRMLTNERTSQPTDQRCDPSFRWLMCFLLVGWLVKESRTYLLYKPSYSQFSVKISKFPLPWQRGLV